MSSTPNPTSPNYDLWNLSYIDDAYGANYGGMSVQIAMIRTLKKWLPAYIKEANRQIGGDVLEIVTEYERPSNDRAWSPSTDVQITVTVPGTAGEPIETNESGIISCWKADLDVFVYAGTDWQECLALTYAYGACARAAIVQHRGLEGFATTTKWTGESYFKGNDTGSRFFGIATVNFDVTVSNTLNQFGGPPSEGFAALGTSTDPSLLPIPDFPDVIDTDVTIANLTH